MTDLIRVIPNILAMCTLMFRKYNVLLKGP
jgi:hypothetical protein